ncbi:MAG: molybdopterin-binding protein [Clostridia bacterium]|nr:MAG: molybdopterin-binding protein [Clostridia bacterium]
MLKKVPVRESVGLILGHDVTKVVPGEFKGAAFRKGHKIRAEDIPQLLDMGKEHIYVYEPGAGEVHEDEAALRLATALAGEGLKWAEPKEGKVSLVAARPGLLRAYRRVVDLVNSQEDTVVATLHDAQPVAEGQVVAGVRVIPLVVPEATVTAVEQIAAEKGPALEVKAFKNLEVGVIVTGNEVFSGRIHDVFAPRVREKLDQFGSSIGRLLYLPDGAAGIAAAIKEMVAQGMEMVLVCGGMSVDADDTTPAGISQSGAAVVVRGTPIFPGAMFMLAYLGEVPVLGLPACVLHDPTTVFDLVLPRLLAREKVTREEIITRGVGGLCRQCATCTYPACSFGK